MRRLEANQIKGIIKEAQVGESLGQLSRRFGLSKTTVYYHARRFCRKMGRFDERHLTEWEKGYLVGFFVGDGCFVFRPKHWSYITKFVLNARTEKAIADFLAMTLSKAGINPWTTIEGNRLNLRASSKSLQVFLKNYAGYELEMRKLRKRLFLNEILRQEKEFGFGVLAGLIDSDGYVGYAGYKRRSLAVMITTASRVLADLMVQMVKELGMDATIITQYRSRFGTSYFCFHVRVLTRSAIMNVNNMKSLKLQQVFNGGFKTN